MFEADHLVAIEGNQVPTSPTGRTMIRRLPNSTGQAAERQHELQDQAQPAGDGDATQPIDELNTCCGSTCTEAWKYLHNTFIVAADARGTPCSCTSLGGALGHPVHIIQSCAVLVGNHICHLQQHLCCYCCCQRG
jgi:hypothetical protein